ncbi:MAG TPA: ABC transporter permease [Gemmatimonadaceae bacterium]|nr:ABC transporter permease [Gemmatimonadaceae bacterium]
MRRVFRIPFSKSGLARAVDDEISFHLQSRIDALIAGGMTPEEARATAAKQFGDLDGVRHDMLALDAQREFTQRRASFVAELRQDVAFGARMLRRNAGVTALVVGGLALGIGANGAIYSLIDAVLLRALPVPHPNALVIVGDPNYADSRGHGTPDGRLYSYLTYTELRDSAPAFEGLAAVGDPDRLDARIDASAAEPEHPQGRMVSGNYFAVLGARTAAGRTFDRSADEPDAPLQATISYDYWTRRFHNDPSVVGRDIRINGNRATITGVTARGFTGEMVGASPDVWLPISARDHLYPNAPVLRDRRMMWLLFIGRLRPGETIEHARATTSPIIRAHILAAAQPDELTDIRDRGGFTFLFAPGARGLSIVRDTFATPLVTLMLGVALLLCIVCLNVANLLLARGVARQREMSLRLAVGADRARIVRQLLTESVLLAIVSGAAAVVAAWWGSRALVTMASFGQPISVSLEPNARVLAFTLGLALASVLVFGLVPALRVSRGSRVSLADALRASSRPIVRGARFGSTFIGVQVALSLLLLAGASVLTRGLRRTESAPLGFDRDHLIAADLDIATPGYSGDRLAAVVHALRDRVGAVPGVAAVSYSLNGVFSGTDWHTSVNVAGFTARVPRDSSTGIDRAGAGYASAIGARLIAGRDFNPADEGRPARTALVNESFARFYFQGANPVGRLARFDDSSVVEIVGEFADARTRSLDTATSPGEARRIYIPYLVRSGTTKFSQPAGLRLIVRTKGDPSATLQSVRRAIVETDRALAIDDIAPVSRLIQFSIRDEHLLAQIATALGTLAVLLAAIGLFGVMSYSIARRTNEIGVRLALGAQHTDIARLVMRDGMRPVVAGVVVGLPASVVAFRELAHHVSGVAIDPVSIAIAVAVLFASATAAILLPARRAMRIDPLGALRQE